MYIIVGSHFVPLEGKFLLVTYCKDNIKCDSASNAPKCPLNNGSKMSIVQKLIKLSNTSTTFWHQVDITLMEVFENKLLNDGHTVD